MNFCDIERKLEDIYKIKDLKDLFELWMKAHKLEDEASLEKTKIEGIPVDSFIEDGYICENKKQFNGILFILKEANILKYGAENQKIYRGNQFEFYKKYINNEEGDIHSKQKEKMGRMAHYILTGKINKDDDFKKSLGCSAYMNLNKRGGGKSDKTSKQYSNKYSNFIKKQIELIKPKKIICLGTYKQLKKINIITCENENDFIDVWHPAYPMPKLKRNNTYKLNDLNVDLYMEEFINRCKKID
jgi:hypothetical protein